MSIQEDGPIMEQSNNLEVILVRMEGKIDRFNDRMDRYERDHDSVRRRVHELGNEVAKIATFNLAERIAAADTWRAQTEQRLKALEGLELQRKGAAQLIKVLWAIAGAVGVGGVAAVLRVLNIG